MEEATLYGIAALDDHASAALRALAGRVADEVDDFAHDIALYTLGRVPELGGTEDQDAYALTRGVSRANIGSMATMLKFGVPPDGIHPPAEALEFAVGMLRRGVDVAAILRAYQVGHRRLWRMWMSVAEEHVADPATLAAILDASSEFIFAWIDATAQQLVLRYAQERERWLHGAAAVRMETARAIASGQELPVDVASGRLRYELRRHHVAIVGWISGAGGEDTRGGLDRLEREGIALAHTICDSEALVIPGGRDCVWFWTSAYDSLDAGALPLGAIEADDLRFATGDVGHGLEGFRRSHHQAERARQLATMAGLRASVVRFRDVALASTLCADPAQALAFATAELGVLAGEDETARRLRETLSVYLETCASPLHAANRLGVHAKTVAYRMRRVEELLGRPVASRRRELEAALLVYATLGPRD